MCAGGALGPGLGAGGGPGGSGLARQRPLFLPLLSPPLKGQALRAPGGKREGSAGPARDGHAPGPGTLFSRALGGCWGRRAGSSRRAGAPCPRPLQGVPEASLPRSGVGRSLVRWSLPLPPPPSGFRGLRDRGAGIGDPSPLHQLGAGLGLTPLGLSLEGETFSNRGLSLNTLLRHLVL